LRLVGYTLSDQTSRFEKSRVPEQLISV